MEWNQCKWAFSSYLLLCKYWQVIYTITSTFKHQLSIDKSICISFSASYFFFFSSLLSCFFLQDSYYISEKLYSACSWMLVVALLVKFFMLCIWNKVLKKIQSVAKAISMNIVLQNIAATWQHTSIFFLPWWAANRVFSLSKAYAS